MAEDRDENSPDCAVLIVAAGRGERAGADTGSLPKQYRLLGGKPVLRWSVDAFLAHPAVSQICIAIRETDRGLYDAATNGLTLLPPVIGGETRQETVRRGLEALSKTAPRRVLIHDAARPFVSAALISRILAALDGARAAAPFVAVADTLRRARDGGGFDILSRDGVVRAQTPQGFDFAAIFDAHACFSENPATDDVALAERAGLTVAVVPGEEINMKLTTPEDFVLAERLANSAYGTRTGTGFDVHRFCAGDHVWLCGVKVRNEFGLEGHSDADAGLHALTDAILGALGAEDIGAHFPPTDARWRGTPSHLFLAHAAALVRARNGVIAHVDITLICERPKIAVHRDAMRARIAEILEIAKDRVSVKATTTEGLGFTGRREGIAAQAIATLRLPE